MVFAREELEMNQAGTRTRSLEIAIQPWVHKGSLRAKAVSHGIVDSRLITRSTPEFMGNACNNSNESRYELTFGKDRARHWHQNTIINIYIILVRVSASVRELVLESRLQSTELSRLNIDNAS